MAVDFDELREIAEEVIEEWGGPGQIILKGVIGGDSVGGDPIPDTPDTIINGIITPLVQYKTHEIDGTSILNGDAWIFWQTNDATKIKVDMQVTLNSNTFSIKSVGDLSSIDDVNVYLKLQLRIG